MSGLRVAIFGATSGIATAVARRLAADGARLVLIGRDPEHLMAAAADMKIRGAAEVAQLTADFTTLAALPGVAAGAWNMFGGLDAALIAYGSLPRQDAVEYDPQALAGVILLNLTSPAVLCLELAGRFERSRSGVIAVITSVAGDRGRQSNYAYGTAKGGLQRFLEGLRHRLYGSGVQVLDIRPGFVATRMTEHLPQAGPLWVGPDRVAADIARAIRQRRAVLYTPWFWRYILAIVRALPRSAFHRTSL